MSHGPPDIEPLAPELDELLGAERAAPDPADRIARRVHGRVRTTVAIAAGVGAAGAGAKVASAASAGTTGVGAAGSAAGALALAKPMAIAVAAIGVSAGIGAGTRALVETGPPPSPPPVIEQRARPERPGPMPGPEPALQPALDAGVVAAEPDAAVIPAAAPAGIDAAVDDTVLTPQRLADERTLLAAARADLAASAPRSALTALEEHELRHPDGLLGEERDALRVQALAAAGRGAEAGRRARAFLDRYPDSIHRTVIERLADEEDLP